MTSPGLDPAALREAAAQLGLDVEDRPVLEAWAAIGATHLYWRNTALEDWHAGPDSRISDAEMFRINVSTTRIFRTALRGVADIDALEQGLEGALAVAFHPLRVLPGGRNLLDLGAEETEDFIDVAEVRVAGLIDIADEHGVDTALLAVALDGRLSCHHWWGSPLWPGVVDVVMRRLGDPDDDCWQRLQGRPVPAEVHRAQRLRWLLLDSPDALAIETVDFLIHQLGIGFITAVEG
ncbi:hypothetical protein [Quadrisphaera setariae]|uniref:Uncharacterized protein n=1 Tax=Quadrisphaera setariae TaxID=2593304 RepID=A0A5C8ZEA1_9ACTN|nr:hypothetical protein [Quadrisphaera setariae]TXR55501.1 hypothetical protein FMM08_14415 [Quadrisphaera setariae]